MIWVAKNLYFFNCLLDGAHTIVRQPHFVCAKRNAGIKISDEILQAFL